MQRRLSNRLHGVLCGAEDPMLAEFVQQWETAHIMVADTVQVVPAHWLHSRDG